MRLLTQKTSEPNGLEALRVLLFASFSEGAYEQLNHSVSMSPSPNQSHVIQQ